MNKRGELKTFYGIIVMFVLVGLSFIALTNFIHNTYIDNGSDVNFLGESVINDTYSNVTYILNTYDQDVNSSLQSFSVSQPQTSTESIQILSISNIWKTLVIIPFQTSKVMMNLLSKSILTSEAKLVLVIFSTLLGVLILLTALKVMRQGEGLV